jgi:hypothetical protein
MHFEILVEDLSGKNALDILIPMIIDESFTFTIHPYKGIGRIPGNMRDTEDPQKRILLENLPKLLKGYGRTFANYSPEYPAAVILICDLDARDRNTFLAELNAVLDACHPRPNTRFCLAIEEGEAWFLGDLNAIRTAYPNAKNEILTAYINDSICGTWEHLANAVYAGGASKLGAKGWQAVGKEKSKWAVEISPLMNIDINQSPSFQFLRMTLESFE